jgi:mannose-6-phosphate isomerase
MQPIVFAPFFRPQIWGQRRLEQRLGKTLPADGTFGESWEISAHRLHVSLVAEGPFSGMSLTELWQKHGGELTGNSVARGPLFPLLLKYLDCHKLLSVQVHPNDGLAQTLVKDESGKTEAWVVLAVENEGRVYAGFQPGVTPRDLERHLDAGTVGECLHTFQPHPGDCLYLPAGAIHTAQGGVLVAEVQQTSDATFRLFDWNRLGPDGKPRALHREEALRAIDWSIGPVRPQVPSKLAESENGSSGERLVTCRHFCMDRYVVGGLLSIPYKGQMSVWTVLAGQAQLTTWDGYQRRFRLGESVLVPASAELPSWHGDPSNPATLLAAIVP